MTSDRALATWFLVLFIATALAGAEVQDWTQADSGHDWSFPRDHWAHEGFKTEWWYFTGQVESDEHPARGFGYQFAVFKVGILPERPSLDSAWSTGTLLMAHAAVADLSTGEHRFSEVIWREIPLLAGFGRFPEARIAWSRPPGGTEDLWSLDWNGAGFDFAMRDDAKGFALSLSATPTKGVVLHGDNGLSRKADRPGAASLYYSLTRLETKGAIRIGGHTWRVRGESWMDKEFTSSLLGRDQTGWDWFGLRLADGRDLMLYVLRRADGSVDFRGGSIVTAAGETRSLAPEEWSVRSVRTWRSPHSGAEYPSGWTVEIPTEGLRLEVAPDFEDQENRAALAGIVYWEGSVAVRDPKGRPLGVGYVELTGYAPGSRPPM